MPFTPTKSNTLIFLCLFILAFFPHAFFHVLKAPLAVLPFLTGPHDVPTSPQTHGAPPICPPCTPSSSLSCTPHEPSHRMSWFQKTLTLPSRSRGAYLITNEIESALPELKTYRVGILHLFIQHTSCGLSLNENWDSDVRADMSDALDRLAPEDPKGGYRHDAEGRDDMPAHIKSTLTGASVSVPISEGRLALGTWQGVWYLEFRQRKHTRRVVATIQGEKFA